MTNMMRRVFPLYPFPLLIRRKTKGTGYSIPLSFGYRPRAFVMDGEAEESWAPPEYIFEGLMACLPDGSSYIGGSSAPPTPSLRRFPSWLLLEYYAATTT